MALQNLYYINQYSQERVHLDKWYHRQV